MSDSRQPRCSLLLTAQHKVTGPQGTCWFCLLVVSDVRGEDSAQRQRLVRRSIWSFGLIAATAPEFCGLVQGSDFNTLT